MFESLIFLLLHNPLPLTERVRMLFVLAFGAVALMLASVGLYGVSAVEVGLLGAVISILTVAACAIPVARAMPTASAIAMREEE